MYLCFTFFNKVINSYNSITFNSIFIIQNNIKILMYVYSYFKSRELCFFRSETKPASIDINE